MPRIAGILNIIAGAIGILGGILVIGLLIWIMNPPYNDYGLPGQYLRNPLVQGLFILYFVANVIAIAGGVMAVKRKVWGLALTGAICSLLSVWGWSLGIASLVFLVLSRKEFDAPAISPENTIIQEQE
jgi:hypothetical protein